MKMVIFGVIRPQIMGWSLHEVFQFTVLIK